MDPDHERAVLAYFSGQRSPGLLAQLAEAGAADAEFRAEFGDELALDRVLHELGRPEIDAAPVLGAIARRTGVELQNTVMGRISVLTRRRHRRPGRWLASGLGAAAAVVAAVIGARLALHMNATPPPAPATIATLHAMRTLVWAAGKASPPGEGARLLPGTLELASGACSLRFDNAASLIVEGPARLELVSPLLVRLYSGQATTEVPESAHGFTISAGDVQVIDLGTEVGVAARPGGVDVQVYRGVIDLAQKRPGQEHLHVAAGAAVRVAEATGTVTPLPFVPGRFMRSSASSLLVDLADVVGGGRGRGDARYDGVDPHTGKLCRGQPLDNRPGDGIYHAVPGQAIIDGVFIPTPGGTSTRITSQGAHYRFSNGDNLCFDIIRRGGFMITSGDGHGQTERLEPTHIGGVDYAEFGHSLIGMHANMGMTIDLHALAQTYGSHARRLTARVANTAVTPGPTNLFAIPIPKDVQPAAWQALAITTTTTTDGTHLTLLADGSLLAKDAATNDTYTVVGTTPLNRVSALRLEVLSDPSLPGGGPGMSPRGNFVLSSLHASWSAATGGPEHELGVIGAVADFSQNGWTIEDTVSERDQGGWGIVPETGKNHTAFFFINPVTLPSDARITVRLAQLQPGCHQHLIGRLRISLTDDRDPARGITGGGSFFLVLLDGQLQERTMVPLASGLPVKIDIPILGDPHFLTLVTCDGGLGDAYQWITLGDPRLDMESSTTPR